MHRRPPFRGPPPPPRAPVPAAPPPPLPNTDRSVFFTGVPLFVEKNKLRQHFDSVGHTTDFRLFGPVPGKDFRYGIVEYMDEKTAEEAIARLNGTTFGERAMRVTAAVADRLPTAITNRKRVREPFAAPQRPTTDRLGRELLAFPAGFVDPILTREDSVVMECLRGMATEDAYEAVEQLRVLALERRQDAKLLLQENPALRAAVVIILQHAGKLSTGPLPPEAFQSTASAAGRGSVAGGGPPSRATGGEGRGSTGNRGGPAGAGAGSSGSAAGGVTPSSGRSRPGSSAPTPTLAPSSAAPPPPSPAPSSTASSGGTTTTTTARQRDEVLQLISNMSEADVERILTMSEDELALVADPMQRRQLEVLRARLLEMTSDL